MAKKLVIDLDVFNNCYEKLDTATVEMESIQKKLAKAMEEMLKNGWVGEGSDAFNSQFEASWVDGIEDRVAVMKRMCEQINNAITQYKPIETAAANITISR